uniref:FYVE-type domain-containing protein n=1 Tax=Helicotheca tamesis TaxID=374047 RepID=A0A7S2I2Z2_9STRA
MVLDSHEFEKAKTFAPKPLPPPAWENASSCYKCSKPFSHTLHRHHCRLCGHSYCHPHSSSTHLLPHFGYDPDVPERVCASCKAILEQHNLAERIAWRMARIRDYLSNNLTPYFETGVDTVEDVAYRITRAAIRMARSIPLGAQAHVAVETIEVLRKHGLKGVYDILDFLVKPNTISGYNLCNNSS